MTKILLPRGYRDPNVFHKKLHEDTEKKWNRRAKTRAVGLFHEMADRVPAYKDYLKKHNFDPKTVKNIVDFKKIPAVDKDNYLKKYSKEQLCWNGEFANHKWTISTTSGSSGEPYYFPREKSQSWQYAVLAEQYLRNNFDIANKSTLYIIAFPMGAWIGGVFTYEALEIISENSDYNLSIITAGISKQEVINSVKQLGKSFDQIIIGAYAPFLKDILDDGELQGVKWSDFEMGFVFSAEAFNESFREYVARLVKPKDYLRFSLNHYGTVDLGTMAHETPESVLIRKLLIEYDKLDVLFPEKQRQPTFCQYDPSLFYFEQEGENLLCSAFSGIPLTRYDLKDYGGVISRREVHRKLKKSGIDIEAELKKHKIQDISWNVPFLYVYERNDFSVSYYSFLVYPDMIRRPLLSRELEKKLTGKFSMNVEYNKAGRQHFYINIEKKAGISSNKLEREILEILHLSLINDSSEYRETFRMIGEPAKPIIKLWEYENEKYFKSGAKQKWVIK